MSKWMTAEWTVGQLNALVKRLGGEKIARGILDGTVKFNVTARVREFLTPTTEIKIPAVENPRNPRTYLQNRKGLAVSSYFQKLILSNVGKLEETPEITLTLSTLVKWATDAEIMGETGEPMDATIFGHVLDYLIQQQMLGGAGPLPADGNWIMVHVRADDAVFTVRFYWYHVGQEWNVFVHRLGSNPWFEGCHVVSFATA